MLATLIFLVTFGVFLAALCWVASWAGLLVSNETNAGWIAVLAIIFILSAAGTVTLNESVIEKWGWTFVQVDLPVVTIDCPVALRFPTFGDPPPNPLPRIDGC